MAEIQYVKVQFPELSVRLNDSPKLRGYFAEKYYDETPMHNHTRSKFIYEYPKVQYKVIAGIPTIIGVGDFSERLLSIMMGENEIILDGEKQKIVVAEVKSGYVLFGISEDIKEYKFVTPWIALNEENIKKYTAADEIEKVELLERILIGNMISMSRGLGIQIEARIKVKANLRKVNTHIKDNNMLGFYGTFKTNFEIPEYVGLGKSVSRGFGSVALKN